VVVPLAGEAPPPDPSAGEPPPTGGDDLPPSDGSTDPDDEPEWYRNPRVMVPVAALVLLAGVLGGFLLFSSDDDSPDQVASTDSTTSTTEAATSTTAAQTTSTAAATATTAAADGTGGGDSDTGGGGSSTDQAFTQLELARGNWGLQPSGARYVMSHTVEGEGVGTWCVEGTVGDDNATLPFAQGQGCGSDGGTDPFGTLGVSQWHDQIADWISRGVFVSASYDASGRPNQVATTEADGLTITFAWLVPPGG
jgi:hypothetical protein